MDSLENVVSMCRECHTELHWICGQQPTKSYLHRDAMVANARKWLSLHPGGGMALPQWLEEVRDGEEEA